MTHPLTDEIYADIWLKVDEPDYQLQEYMRAAADWQLEQVIEWLKECPNYDIEPTGLCWMIQDLKEAMRPQQ